MEYYDEVMELKNKPTVPTTEAEVTPLEPETAKSIERIEVWQVASKYTFFLFSKKVKKKR